MPITLALESSAATPPQRPVEAVTLPAATPPSSSAIRVGITASEPVWVSAPADGKIVLSEMLTIGSSKS